MSNELPAQTSAGAQPGKPWHALTVEHSLSRLGLSHGGLTTAEANARREKYGPNELRENGGRTVWNGVENS